MTLSKPVAALVYGSLFLSIKLSNDEYKALAFPNILFQSHFKDPEYFGEDVFFYIF